MEILSVTLKNFKSHRDRHFIFQPGTNAICGENGAGKTSILEAIAWVLFNHRGAYKTEDLIYNGGSSAQVTVSFISHRDGRTYSVQRCTTKGYSIYDPQLGQTLDCKHIEDEVMPWIRQQLGVPAGTDLARLFANTIGVPQGTFTVDFLQSPKERKSTFDSILKVEEYQKAYTELRQLEKYAEAQADKLEDEIARYSSDLENWDGLQYQRQRLVQEMTEAETTLAQLQAQLQQLQGEKDRLTMQSQQVQQLNSRLQQLNAQIDGKQQAQQVLKQAVDRSRQAVQTCEAHRQGHQAYLQVEAALQQLDQHSKQRQALLKQRESQQITLVQQQTELNRLSLKLEELQRSTTELEQLTPLIAQQEELERQQAGIAEQLNQLQAFKLEQQTLSRQFTKLQTEQTRLSQEIDRIQALQTQLSQIPALEQKRDRLQEQLSRVEAAKQFESDLRQLVTDGEIKRDQHQSEAEQALAILRQVQQAVPLLASDSVESALSTITAGVELNTDLLNALWRILADLSEQISAPKLQQQLRQLKTQLDSAYQQRAEVTTLEAKQEQQAQLQLDLQQIQTRLRELHTQLGTESEWQQRRSQVLASLKQLGDPRGYQQRLKQQLQQQPQIQAEHTRQQNALNQIQERLTALDAELAQFTDLPDQIEQQQQLRQQHQPAYLNYLQHQKDAQQLPTLEAQLQTSLAQIEQLMADRATLQVEYDQLTQDYDPAQWQQVEAQYAGIRSQADRISGGLPQQRKLLMQIDSQIAVLEATAAKRDRAQTELKQKEKIRRFITFARKVFKEAAPRITDRYVQTISREADRLFRELLNRPNVALTWAKDYEILVQEGAHSRRFVNLSGGEQMCAALAVRLALLRVLADIDVAFFDEPTTNMDRPRRESLAEAIANLKSLRQLFVISHDDTFEKVTENIILVEREV